MATSIGRGHLPNTQAYLRLKEQTQSVFDLNVVIAYGVTSLRRNIGLLERGVIANLPLPDGFIEGNNTPTQLREWAAGYRLRVAASATLTLFSYFEAFVPAIIREMIDFHGGPAEFQRRAEAYDRRFMSDDADVEKLRRWIRGPVERGKEMRNIKFTKELAKIGYRFPTELFSGYGARVLIQKLGNLRAADIPDLLREGLHMEIDDDAVAKFHDVRNLRNRIAHGDAVNLTFRDVARKNDILKKLSYDLDRHLNLHFFVSEVHAGQP